MKIADLILGRKYLYTPNYKRVITVCFERIVPNNLNFAGEAEFDNIVLNAIEVDAYISETEQPAPKTLKSLFNNIIQWANDRKR